MALSIISSLDIFNRQTKAKIYLFQREIEFVLSMAREKTAEMKLR